MGRHGTAGTVGCLHANRLPLLIPGAPRGCGGDRHPLPSTDLGQAGITVRAVVAQCKC